MDRTPSIQTDRLVLRGFRAQDLGPLAAIVADAEVVRFLPGGRPWGRHEAEAILDSFRRHWLFKGFGVWALEDREKGWLRGWCGLQTLAGTPEVELVYALSRRAWGRGLATEAAAASLRYGFEELDLPRIVAASRPDHQASLRVMEKLGMCRDRTDCFRGMEVVLYAIAQRELSPLAGCYELISDTDAVSTSRSGDGHSSDVRSAEVCSSDDSPGSSSGPP